MRRYVPRTHGDEPLIEGIKKGDYDKANKAYEQMEEQLDD